MSVMFIVFECNILCFYFQSFVNDAESVYMEHFYSDIDNTLFSSFVYFCKL